MTWTLATEAFRTKIDETIGRTFDSINGYREIPEALAVEDQWETYLSKGYAVNLGPATTRAQSVKQRRIEDRAYQVVLTKEITTTGDHVDKRMAVKEGILEDAEALRVAFDADHNLSGNVVDANWGGDSGIDIISDTDEQGNITAKYYIMAVEFVVTIDFRT